MFWQLLSYPFTWLPNPCSHVKKGLCSPWRRVRLEFSASSVGFKNPNLTPKITMWSLCQFLLQKTFDWTRWRIIICVKQNPYLQNCKVQKHVNVHVNWFFSNLLYSLDHLNSSPSEGKCAFPLCSKNGDVMEMELLIASKSPAANISMHCTPQ